MPELPDITAYLTALTPRVLDQPLEHLRIASPLLLRTAIPPSNPSKANPSAPSAASASASSSASPTDELFLVLHLMIAGRLHWRDLDPKKLRPTLGGRNNLAAFDFPNGTLTLTEAGTKRRASLHLVRGEQALADLDPGGLDPLALTLESSSTALTAENHTLKRALTDPRILSGIGNAYSDEILHAAQLSPIAANPQTHSRRIPTPLHRHPRHAQTWISPLQRRSPMPSPKRSPPSAPRWPRTAASASPAPLRLAHPAHPLRRQRDQLLPHLPDQRQSPRRPQPLPPPRLRLAPHPRRARSLGKSSHGGL